MYVPSSWRKKLHPSGMPNLFMTSLNVSWAFCKLCPTLCRALSKALRSERAFSTLREAFSSSFWASWKEAILKWSSDPSC